MDNGLAMASAENERLRPAGDSLIVEKFVIRTRDLSKIPYKSFADLGLIEKI